MTHLDRELHKLAIALESEAHNEAVALVCVTSSLFTVLLMRADPRDILGEIGRGATAHEALQSALHHTQDRRDELARTHAARHGSPLVLLHRLRRKDHS